MVAEVAYGSAAEAERAIDAASRAFPAWRALSAYDRGKILKKTADLMRDRVETIGRTLTQEQGKPLAEAKTEVLHAADTFEWFAEEGKRTYGRIIPPANVQKRYYAIKHPVEIVHGMNDALVPFANVAFLQAHLTGVAHLEVNAMPGQNHFLPWNAKAQVMAALAKGAAASA